MKIYASLIPVLFLVLATISTDVHMNANETVNVTNDEPILPLKIQCTQLNSSVDYLASLSDVSSLNLNSPPILLGAMDHSGTPGGSCDDAVYSNYDCNNPYGACPPGGGAGYSEENCIIACAASDDWINCDGCPSPCIE